MNKEYSIGNMQETWWIYVCERERKVLTPTKNVGTVSVARFLEGSHLLLAVIYLWSFLSFSFPHSPSTPQRYDAAEVYKMLRRKRSDAQTRTFIHIYIYICLYTFRIYMHVQYVLFTHSSQIKKKYSMLHKNTLSKIQQFELWECLFLIKILIHRICVIIFKS